MTRTELRRDWQAASEHGLARAYGPGDAVYDKPDIFDRIEMAIAAIAGDDRLGVPRYDPVVHGDAGRRPRHHPPAARWV